MNGVLIVAHGSRAKDTIDAMNKIVAMVKQKMPEKIIEVAYMEICDVNIEIGMNNLMRKGVKNIKVVPYFLFNGIHIKEDIPKELDNFIRKYPDIAVTFGQTLGVDERLADILADRIAF